MYDSDFEDCGLDELLLHHLNLCFDLGELDAEDLTNVSENRQELVSKIDEVEDYILNNFHKAM